MAEPAEWSLVALSYLGLIDTFLEPDPGYAGRPPGAWQYPQPGA
jgi:hypothetical protein